MLGYDRHNIHVVASEGRRLSHLEIPLDNEKVKPNMSTGSPEEGIVRPLKPTTGTMERWPFKSEGQ